jgi:hypothetical protein
VTPTSLRPPRQPRASTGAAGRTRPVPGTRADPYYAAHLPGLLRTALAADERELATPSSTASSQSSSSTSTPSPPSKARAAPSTPPATTKQNNPLRECRDLFRKLGYQPALAETEALLDGD